MKTRIVLLSLIALVSILTSCNKNKYEIIPSKNVTSIEKSVAIENRIDITGPFQVYLTFSDTEESIIVEANENLHTYIDIENKNGWLKINTQKYINITNSDRVMNIYITTKNINEYQLEGASSISLENELYADNLSIELSGASNFTGNIYTKSLYATLLGASKIDVSGNTELLDINAEGACSVKNFHLETTQLEAKLNGGSEVYSSVSESLKVRAHGGSNVYYKGNGVIQSQDLSGGSSIKKMD